MKHHPTFLFSLLLSASFVMPPDARAHIGNTERAMSGASKSGAQTVNQEKRSRTAAQQKIDSQLLYALYRKRGEAEARGVATIEPRVKFDAKGRAIVTIRARVTRRLLAKIKSIGGEVISSSEQYNDILARVPLEKLEKLAALKDVSAIMPAEEATTNK
ncbi:MAG TPA: hypothetical protein VF543_10355 [Pyrinomonadaceae bacterium]|jgi:Ser-tRNA(Ala) deacylase AlaX